MGLLIYVRGPLGPNFSEGSRLLFLAAKRAGLTQEALRARLGRSKGVVGDWLRGKSKPDGESRGRIYEKFGIKPHLFDQKPTKPFSLESAA